MVNGKNIRLTFPAGIENGQVIKVAGNGSAGINRGTNGDLYITFSIKNDTKFKREDQNLSADVDLDLFITYQQKLPKNLTEKEIELFRELITIRNAIFAQ